MAGPRSGAGPGSGGRRAGGRGPGGARGGGLPRGGSARLAPAQGFGASVAAARRSAPPTGRKSAPRGGGKRWPWGGVRLREGRGAGSQPACVCAWAEPRLVPSADHGIPGPGLPSLCKHLRAAMRSGLARQCRVAGGGGEPQP